MEKLTVEVLLADERCFIASAMAMLEDADKVYDVAMLASSKVIPLIVFGIDFERGCLFISEGRTIPIGVTSDVLRTISVLLEVVYDGLLFDVV